MQTIFMHPPFGFALFYLRGIAPKEVKSSDIYWGAIPWVGLQLMLVAIIIFWPGLVTGFVDRPAAVEPGRTEIVLPPEETPPPPEAPADRKDGAADPSAEIDRMLRQGSK